MGNWLLERRLSQNAARLKSLRAELAQIDEQLAVFADDADDSAIRALVSETRARMAVSSASSANTASCSSICANSVRSDLSRAAFCDKRRSTNQLPMRISGYVAALPLRSFPFR